ncbi:hypothetical protein GCM10009737_26280 [Nocardioides lentus]|uniref:CshA domain-containing protein n=1 Tax=Nocardioides lentus TaxID=338077 RepID=A0ABN2PMI4_9ACTN
MSGHLRLVRPWSGALAMVLLAAPAGLGVVAPAGATPDVPARCAAPTDDAPAAPATRPGSDGESVVVDVRGSRDGATADDLDTDAVVFARTGQPRGTVRVSPTWVEVPGQGTWTVDADSGDVVLSPGEGSEETVVFTPEKGYDARSDTDPPGSGSSPEVPAPALRASCGALGLPDAARTDQGVGVTLRPLDNDVPGAADDGERATFVGSTVRLDAGAGPEGVRATDDGLTVPGEGTWTVGAAGRTVTFAPADGFTGRTGAVRYRARDSAGHRLSSTLRVEVGVVAPSAKPDTARTAADTPVLLDVLTNDEPGVDAAPLDPDSLRLLDDAERVGELAVAGEGAWSVVDGELEYAPAADFAGTTERVRYSVADTNGTRATSTAQVAVAGAEGPEPEAVDPFAERDMVTAPFGEDEVRIPVLENDRPRTLLTTGKLFLRDSGAAEADVKTLPRVAGEGTWSVVNRELRFEPVQGFSGPATVVYRVYVGPLSDGVFAQSRVRLTVEDAVVPQPTEVTTPSDTPITTDVLEAFDVADGVEDALRPGTVTLFPTTVRVDGTPLKNAGDAAAGSKDVQREDVGRWQVGEDGQVTFTPRGGFVGRAAIDFRVRAAGSPKTFYTSRLAVEVTRPAVNTTTPVTSPPGTTTPYTSTTTTTTPAGTLPDTGGPTLLALVAGLALVGAGGVVVRRSRRTT